MSVGCGPRRLAEWAPDRRMSSPRVDLGSSHDLDPTRRACHLPSYPRPLPRSIPRPAPPGSIGSSSWGISEDVGWCRAERGPPAFGPVGWWASFRSTPPYTCRGGRSAGPPSLTNRSTPPTPLARPRPRTAPRPSPLGRGDRPGRRHEVGQDLRPDLHPPGHSKTGSILGRPPEPSRGGREPIARPRIPPGRVPSPIRAEFRDKASFPQVLDPKSLQEKVARNHPKRHRTDRHPHRDPSQKREGRGAAPPGLPRSF